MTWLHPSAVASEVRMPRNVPSVAAPARRQPAELDREGHDQQHADPERRDREAQHRQRHDRLGAETVRLVAGVDPRRDSHDRRDRDRHQDQLQRRWQAREDEAGDGGVVDHRPAEVALRDIAEERQVLAPQRLVEAILPDQVLADLLRRAGIDHNVDRIADRIDADEDDHRHDEHHHDGLHQSADDESQHGASRSGKGRPGGTPRVAYSPAGTIS